MEQPPKPETPLGLIQIDQNTFEHDLAVSERYQNFSAELLRLSLLGMAALGFLLKEVLLTNKTGNTLPKSGLFICLSLLAISGAAALFHRYAGTDSIAFHLKSLRLKIRSAPDDEEKYKKEKKGREWRFKVSKYSLLVSGISLLAGFILIIALFIEAL